MSPSSHDLPTLDHYAFNLRDGLRRAALSSLSELEQSINNIGYGWLDGYMDSIMDHQNRAPITELMKTPSRTQTVKKTRATTAAAKDRTEKVKGLNARLALSPISKQSSRQPLSPLQPRSINAVMLSPTPAQSPKASPLKPEAKPKTRKPRAKKATTNDENTPPTSAGTSFDKSSTSSAARSGSSASKKETGKEPVQEETAKDKSKSSRSKKAVKVHPEPADEPMDVEGTEPEQLIVAETAEAVTQATHIAEPAVGGGTPQPEKENSVAEPQQSVKEPLQVTEATEKIDSASLRPATHEQNDSSHTKHRDDATSLSSQEPALKATEAETEKSTAEVDVEEKTISVSHEAEREHKVDPTMPTSFASIPAPVSGGSNAPVRQVRSSWLHKALGTTTVPVSEANPALRKSVAAPAHQRQSSAVDYAGIRKSLVPVGGLKRKSGEGIDEDEDIHSQRPEKTTKVSINPIGTVDYTDALPARTPGPLARPILPTKTPSFGAAGITHPDSQGRSVPSSVSHADSQRPDIHKVTRALDELREKTAAKELAKQKAVQSAAAARQPQAKSTGTGFLRGIGAIGAGLLGLGGAGAEEEAVRLARELEEERLAEQELERLMRDAVKPDVTTKVEEEAMQLDEVGLQEEEKTQAHRSTTPDAQPLQVAQAPMSPEEEEEMVEEQSIVDDLVVEELQPAITSAQSQRPATREPEVQVISTTPTGTPTKIRAADAEPPANHTRSEDHLHEPSATGQKAEKAPIKVDQRSDDVDEDEDELMGDTEEEVIDDEEDETVELQKVELSQAQAEVKTHRKMPSASSTASNPFTSTLSSQLTAGSVLNQGRNMAAKALGVKPETAPVKSVLLASAAAKKEQAAIERKAQLKEAEAKKALLAKRKAEEERVKAEEERVRAEEERKAKVAEMEEKKRKRAELDKRNKERAAVAAAAAREKAEKERMEKEAQAAKMRAVEEEAARQRKAAAAAALSKSQNGAAGIKRVMGTAGSQQNLAKGKEPFRPTKQNTLGSSTMGGQQSNSQQSKMGPSSFRTAETHQTTSSTITLITQPQPQAQAHAQQERKALGPPSRPSAMAQAQPQPMRQSTAVHQSAHVAANTNGYSSTVLQQSRVALQSQLEEKNAQMQSEDIVLPDIASEYSDSDDEDRTRDFIPPTWAESPQLRAALEAQASRNPDELFGPIKPLNMEELFKVRTGKFRARTSSANWGKGDGLSKFEELEYARRMGFQPVGSNLAHGSTSASGSGNH